MKLILEWFKQTQDIKTDHDIYLLLQDIVKIFEILVKKAVNLLVLVEYGSSCQNYNRYCLSNLCLTQEEYDLFKKYFNGKKGRWKLL